MSAKFTIRIQVGEVVEVLRVVEASLEDPTELMQDVLLVMIRSTQLNFEAQGRPTRWAGLAPSTIKQRLRKVRGGVVKTRGKKKESIYRQLFDQSDAFYTALGSIQILRDRGLLFQSVGGNASGPFEDSDGFGEAEKFHATIGTNRPGADALQLVIAGGRPYLLIHDQDEEDIMDMSVQWVLRTGAYQI